MMSDSGRRNLCNHIAAITGADHMSLGERFIAVFYVLTLIVLALAVLV